MIPEVVAGEAFRVHPADLPLIVQEQLELLADRRDAGASGAELRELVDELLQLRDWRLW